MSSHLYVNTLISNCKVLAETTEQLSLSLGLMIIWEKLMALVALKSFTSASH